MPDSAILVINAGSSSLKFGIYVEVDCSEQLLLGGVADGIGRSDGTLVLLDGDGRSLRSEKCAFATHEDALSEAAHWITESFQERICAVGHRVVHGGPHLIAHQRITASVLQENYAIASISRRFISPSRFS
jgi:acetate kinase